MVGGAGERPVKAASLALCVLFPTAPPLWGASVRLAYEYSTKKRT
jgi:hypothetical protein